MIHDDKCFCTVADDREQTWRTNISMNEQTCRHGVAWGFSWPCTVAPHSTVFSFPAVAEKKQIPPGAGVGAVAGK